jgi:hypothetical protein
VEKSEDESGKRFQPCFPVGGQYPLSTYCGKKSVDPQGLDASGCRGG